MRKSLQGLTELTAVVDELGHQMPLLDAQRAGIEMYGAPRLTPFNLFQPKENALSRIISDLFDPRGAHGQGRLFLNELLASAGFPRVAIRDDVRVDREVFTAKGRRIDIVIETSAF